MCSKSDDCDETDLNICKYTGSQKERYEGGLMHNKRIHTSDGVVGGTGWYAWQRVLRKDRNTGLMFQNAVLLNLKVTPGHQEHASVMETSQSTHGAFVVLHEAENSVSDIALQLGIHCNTAAR